MIFTAFKAACQSFHLNTASYFYLILDLLAKSLNCRHFLTISQVVFNFSLCKSFVSSHLQGFAGRSSSQQFIVFKAPGSKMRNQLATQSKMCQDNSELTYHCSMISFSIISMSVWVNVHLSSEPLKQTSFCYLMWFSSQIDLSLFDKYV